MDFADLPSHEIASRQMYRRIVDAVPEGIWVVDPEGQTIFSNRRMAKILGVNFESMPGQSCFACVFPEDLAEAQSHFASALDGDSRPFDFRLRRADGSPVWVSISCMPVHDETGAQIGLLGLFSDISERKREADALRESEEQLRGLVDGAPVMTWLTGRDNKAIFYNARALAFTGLTAEASFSAGCTALLHPEDRERYREITSAALDARAPFSTEVRLRRADGEYRWILVSGVPRMVNGTFLGHIGTGVDVTDLKRGYEQHLASQKYECLGVLAAGVAHDFNNLLGAIVVRAESAEMDLEHGSSAAEDVQQIRATALRASEVVSQLMSFVGEENGPSKIIDLSELIPETLDLLKVSISKTAVLKTELGADVRAIRANPAEIRQVIMNLSINASEALEGKAGTITITTAPWSLPAGSGPAVRLEVTDSGSGMAAEVKPRIFDPFFTTRFAGRGLGLPVVQGIVRRLGGTIEVESTPGEGSRFTVVLPCASARWPSESTEDHRPDPASPAAATVLLVEDEPALRSAGAKLLRGKNFRVVEAGDGAAAVEFLESDPGSIDVVLLDITLPGMPSGEIFDKLRQIRPDLKVILTTAYSRDSTIAEFRERDTWGFIRKPYNTGDLVKLLRRAVNGGA